MTESLVDKLRRLHKEATADRALHDRFETLCDEVAAAWDMAELRKLSRELHRTADRIRDEHIAAQSIVDALPELLRLVEAAKSLKQAVEGHRTHMRELYAEGHISSDLFVEQEWSMGVANVFQAADKVITALVEPPTESQT